MASIEEDKQEVNRLKTEHTNILEKRKGIEALLDNIEIINKRAILK